MSGLSLVSVFVAAPEPVYSKTWHWLEFSIQEKCILRILKTIYACGRVRILEGKSSLAS